MGMNLRKRLGSWMRDAALGCAISNGLAACALAAQAPATNQTAPVEAQEAWQCMYLNKQVIQLPIQINKEYRAKIREIQLYVKDKLDSPWILRDTVGPDRDAFLFQAPRDGEYAFTMVTIDREGRGMPADLRNEPPKLVVVIDTTSPQITLTNLGESPDGQLVRYEVRDANVNPASMRFFFQGGDKTFRPLDPLPNRAHVYCVPSQAVFTGIVRATVDDLAGNAATSESQISQLPMQPEKVASAPNSSTSNESGPLLIPVDTPTETVTKPTNPTPAKEIVKTATIENPRRQIQRNAPAPKTMTKPQQTVTKSEVRQVQRLPIDSTEGTANSPRPLPTTLPAQPIAKEASNRLVVNQTKVYLDYQIENADQKDVATLETWITRDNGGHWQKLSENPRGDGDVSVQLPADGRYGITLVAANERSAGTPPAKGDAPDWLIEVDTKKPVTTITQTKFTREDGAAIVEISWTASDTNLGDTPVELFYSTTPEGPWTSIAKNLKANGSYEWKPAASIGTHVHLRILARDLAGNESIVNTPEAIQLSDAARPRALIRGIRTEPQAPSLLP